MYKGRRSQRGMALMSALIMIVVVASMAGVMMTMEVASQKEVEAEKASVRNLYLAESGVSEGLAALALSVNTGDDPVLSHGSHYNPLVLHGGEYWTNLAENPDGSYTITATGSSGGGQRAIEVVAVAAGGSVYDNAIFAGNTDEDLSYDLVFGGNGGQADEITGDIFSGNDLTIEGDATVGGSMRASGDITGGAGEEGASQAIPDIASMNYESNHDYDVDALFAGANYKYDSFGGYAYQVGESNPAHIFRKNPSDRYSSTSATVGNDYFLEDPYEYREVDSAEDGSDASAISLSGLYGNSGDDATDAVYFIDGNLWVHSRYELSFKFKHYNSETVKVTFVVKGNIYFSDNLFIQDEDTDGVAFVAMENDSVADSGNIYFGDKSFGTLKQMESFMYAENDFYDYGLDSSGSKDVTVVGNMTAGNKVDINRDHDNGSHSSLTVEFDDRISAGDLDLPGLPTGSSDQSNYSIVSWREIAID